MDLINAQVLITGGSDGIGKALAARFLSVGCKVMVTGRNAEKLRQAQQELPGLLTYINDIGIPQQRVFLADKVKEELPNLSILVNNAGIQRRVALASDQSSWQDRQAEIDILFSAPIHLNHLLIPLLLAGEKKSLIINVTSGGAYIPQVFAPVYSACKAAIHHYTLTLRHALSATNCRVAELIPPAVKTSLAGTNSDHGVDLNEFTDKVFESLFKGDQEEADFGPTDNIMVQINGQSQKELFLKSASRFPVKLY